MKRVFPFSANVPVLCTLMLLGGLACFACGEDASTVAGPTSNTDFACVDLLDQGCDVEDSPDVEPDEVDIPEEGACQQFALSSRLVHSELDVQGGAALHLRLVDRITGEPAPDATSCLQLLRSADQSPMPAQWKHTPPDQTRLTLLLWPGEDPEVTLEAATALLAETPHRDLVTIFLAGHLDRPWAQNQSSPQSLARRLRQLSWEDTAPASWSAIQTFLSQQGQNLDRLHASAWRAHQVVILAPDLVVPHWPELGPHVAAAHWWIAQGPQNPTLQGSQVIAEEEGSVERLVSRFKAEADTFYRLRLCQPADEAVRSPIGLIHAGEQLVGAVPLPGDGVSYCQHLSLSTNDSPGQPVDFVFSPEELARVEGFAETLDRTEFPLHVRMFEGAEPLSANAHFRGRSSLACERKSFNLKIDGPSRPLLPGLVRDEMFLLSMCLDKRYINQLTADAMMAHEGLFPLPHGLRELRINEQSQGVYLLMDKPSSFVDEAFDQPRALIRRKTDIDNIPPDVKFVTSPSVQANYDDLLTMPERFEGQALVDRLRERMDLDQYLRWVAMMSLLQNGDYVDEVWFVATPTWDAQGEEQDFFHIIGWDPDDLFSECHHQGRFALEDPHGLLYCTESILDHGMFADPVVYRLYVEVLQELLALWTPDRFTQQLEDTGERLLQHLMDEQIRAAMTELLDEVPAASSEAGVRDAIIDGLRTMDDTYRQRHALLGERISNYLEVHP